MGKVPDLHPGDSIEVLEVGDTGGIFFHLFEVKLHFAGRRVKAEKK